VLLGQLLDDMTSFNSSGEKMATPKDGSVRGFEVIEAIKSAVEKVCAGCRRLRRHPRHLSEAQPPLIIVVATGLHVMIWPPGSSRDTVLVYLPLLLFVDTQTLRLDQNNLFQLPPTS
jgi:hypothetical protein